MGGVSQGDSADAARPAHAPEERGDGEAQRAPRTVAEGSQDAVQLWEEVGTVPVYSCPAVHSATGKWGERAPKPHEQSFRGPGPQALRAMSSWLLGDLAFSA